ncbi:MULTISPECIES: phage tail protein [Pseudomonas]|uniref:Phage tail protein n=1 Tax=Pseudomonas mosselii TaxID=78327 RepID=A0A5R8ZI18_9PSED|nr:tail fiber protein [Pseudomonas mosselii]TLP65410.1 phage tail protein [Pseudomonas mosselii]
MSDACTGEVRLFAGLYAPQNWGFCDGSLLRISNYPALYALLGTTYGGDGVATFALPDLRGRIPVNQGQGNGLTNRPFGSFGGSETVTITNDNMPAHTHGFIATKATATETAPGPTLMLATLTKTNVVTGLYTDPAPVTTPPTPATPTVQLHPNAVAVAGAGVPRSNIMGSLAMNYIICLQGIYPTFS